VSDQGSIKQFNVLGVLINKEELGRAHVIGPDEALGIVWLMGHSIPTFGTIAILESSECMFGLRRPSYLSVNRILGRRL
jgi:hypothetical protein